MNKAIQLSMAKLPKINWPSANLLPLVFLALFSTVGVMAFQKNLEAKTPTIKSVAWYTANQKEARAQNKECFDNPSLQTTENCINSLHALEMSFKGTNS
jgi:hypothetical protein